MTRLWNVGRQWMILIGPVAAAGISIAQSAYAVPRYAIVALSSDAYEQTSNLGVKQSQAVQLNDAGLVLGQTERRLANDSLVSRTVWLYDGLTMRKIGLLDGFHTDYYGYGRSLSVQMNQIGQVIGTSRYYYGSRVDYGPSAWLFDGATTVNLGMEASSTPHALNSAGTVLGGMVIYDRWRSPIGGSSWLYHGGNRTVIGLTDAEHTASSGFSTNDARQMNEAAQVIGTAWRYNGGSELLGFSAWFYDGSSTKKLGLTGPEYRSSGVAALNEAGYVIGGSARFNGSSAGGDAWIYDGATTKIIGLFDGEHTGQNNYRTNGAWFLNEAGVVSGYAERFNGGSAQLGYSAWLYDGAATIPIGLRGGGYTRDDGHAYVMPWQMNEAGQVIGTSQRFDCSDADVCGSAWFFDGIDTAELGLTAPEYVGQGGLRRSVPTDLNESGQVVGVSLRYNGGNVRLGQDAWFFDSKTNQTFRLHVSARSDGYAFTSIDYLGEDGLALGSYTLFDAAGNDLGRRAYYFTIADGMHDLGSLVVDGLAANGWDSLSSVLQGNRRGQIVGSGRHSTNPGGSTAFLLTPVPEPSGILMAGLGALAVAMSFCRRRQVSNRGE